MEEGLTQSGSLSRNLRLIHNLPEILKLVARAMDLAMIGEEELDTTEMGEFDSFADDKFCDIFPNFDTNKV